MSESKKNTRRPFNSPLESGLRSLFILSEIHPKFQDLQRLVYYDYLLIHSNDVENGPQSLHPPIPHRSGEWLVRRNLVSEGLDLMYSRQLVNKRFSTNGITYGATELTTPFLRYLTSDYAQSIRHNAQWVAYTFEAFSDEELRNFMSGHLGRWGAEFNRESVIRGLPL